MADSRRSLGLGFALCRSIVTAHGGTIGITDNILHGSVFIFYFAGEEVQMLPWRNFWPEMREKL